MTRKGVLIAVASLMILSLLLVACGQAAPSATPVPAAPKTVSPSPTAAPAPVASPSPTAKPSPTATTAAPTTAAPKVITLKSASHKTQTHPYGAGQILMNKLIEDNSGGRLKIQFYPGESLLKLADGFPALQNNTVQISVMKAGYEIGKMGIVGDTEGLPFNYTWNGWANHHYDSGFFDWASKYYEKNGIKLLLFYGYPGNHLASRKPVRKLEDFKGLLIKMKPNSGLEQLGATPLNIDIAELVTGLQRGTLDGAMQSVSTIYSDGIYEYAPYISLVDYNIQGIQVGMNLETFKSLPPDLQKVIDDAARKAHAEYNAKMAPEAVKADLDKLKAKPKVEIITLPKDDMTRMAQLVQPVYDQLAKKYPNEMKQFMDIRAKLLVD